MIGSTSALRATCIAPRARPLPRHRELRGFSCQFLSALGSSAEVDPVGAPSGEIVRVNPLMSEAWCSSV